MALQHTSEEYFRGGYKIRGDVFIELRDGATGELQEQRHCKNIVTLDASILIARLFKNNQEPPFGAFALAIGTGQQSWSPISPPAATNTQRALWSEVARKTFSSTNFVDGDGVPASYPTNVIDLSVVYQESEAVAGLVEMGLLGGNVNPNLAIRNPVSPPNGPYDPTVNLTEFETLLNYLTFGLITKPATSTLGITWRLTF
jgi:hypothetical protein